MCPASAYVYHHTSEHRSGVTTTNLYDMLTPAENTSVLLIGHRNGKIRVGFVSFSYNMI